MARQQDAPRLSEMERQILAGLAKGMPSKEIAELVGRSKPTVEGHIRMLFAKFNARSRTHLIACAFGHGILSKDHL